jgi:phosphatidylserine decarboxylase
LRIWDRKQNFWIEEKVYGEKAVDLLYGNSVGFSLTEHLLTQPWVSRLYGALQSSSLSQAKIEPFIKEFSLAMDEFEPGPFRSFNDFFIRKFRAGARSWPTKPCDMGAPAEGRYLAFDSLNPETALPIKGLKLAATEILGSSPNAKEFWGGPCLLARLCPVDYHRFHFPDSGTWQSVEREGHKLHSVNPKALKRDPTIFLRNERIISFLETENFGLLAYVEVGALMVGRIVASTSCSGSFQRGDEKGYFLFGGSTVIVYGQKGAWSPQQDLLKRTQEGIETLVRLGEVVASAPPSAGKP